MISDDDLDAIQDRQAPLSRAGILQVSISEDRLWALVASLDEQQVVARCADDDQACAIAAAPTDVRYLIDETRRLRAMIADAVALNPHAPTCNLWYQGDCNCWHGVLGDTE